VSAPDNRSCNPPVILVAEVSIAVLLSLDNEEASCSTDSVPQQRMHHAASQWSGSRSQHRVKHYPTWRIHLRCDHGNLRCPKEYIDSGPVQRPTNGTGYLWLQHAAVHLPSCHVALKSYGPPAWHICLLGQQTAEISRASRAIGADRRAVRYPIQLTGDGWTESDIRLHILINTSEDPCAGLPYSPTCTA
jgi:hypothetical protein